MAEKEASILDKLGVDIGFKTTHVKTITEADIKSNQIISNTLSESNHPIFNCSIYYLFI